MRWLTRSLMSIVSVKGPEGRSASVSSCVSWVETLSTELVTASLTRSDSRTFLTICSSSGPKATMMRLMKRPSVCFSRLATTASAAIVEKLGSSRSFWVMLFAASPDSIEETALPATDHNTSTIAPSSTMNAAPMIRIVFVMTHLPVASLPA